jgi:hypothetical protein
MENRTILVFWRPHRVATGGIMIVVFKSGEVIDYSTAMTAVPDIGDRIILRDFNQYIAAIISMDIVARIDIQQGTQIKPPDENSGNRVENEIRSAIGAMA